MFFDWYRKLNQQDRALLDGKLITCHFYVGGITLVALGWIGLGGGESYAWVAVVFGVASLVMGTGLHLLHRHMIQGPQREAYLATVAAALGRQSFPVLPSLLGILVAFSLLVTILYLWVN